VIENSTAMDRPVDSRKTHSRRALLVGGLILVPVVAVILTLPTLTRWLKTERSVQLSRVRVAAVQRGDLERDLSVQGRVVAAHHPTTFSPASGLVSLKVRAGEVVEEGQVLAEVEDPELRNRLEQERSTLLSLESELDRQQIRARQAILADQQRIDLAAVELEAAERAMRRAERSREEQILNDVEFEEAQDNLKRSGLELQHARQDAELKRDTLEFETRDQELRVDRQRLVVSELERQVGKLAVRSPVAGLVSRLDVDDHDAVTPGQPLVAVVDLSEFEIEVMIPESYADEIGLGIDADVSYSGRRFAGSVKSVSPEVEGSQVRGIVAFSEAAPEGMRQNQRVSVRLVLESKSNVLKVARGPFVESGGGREVYAVRGDIAELIEIEVGATSVEEVEILAGLREGDRIIVSDTNRFERAERVYLRD
jgi:HlyD family secretion protein